MVIRGRGDWDSLLDALPDSLAHVVAQRGGPLLTRMMRAGFLKRESVSGKPWPRNRDGSSPTLRDTGKTYRQVEFVVSGTIIRCRLGTPYAKYLIARYGILPTNSRPMPPTWARQMGMLVARVTSEQIPALRRAA